MRQFHHVGIITEQAQPEEIDVPAVGVHVTNPNDHPQRIEYVRFEPDSPVTGPLRTRPHIAFKVESIRDEIAGEQVILGPFEAMDGLEVVFILKDGAIFEFMQFHSTGAFDLPPTRLQHGP
jgi:hypothetical protein